MMMYKLLPKSNTPIYDDFPFRPEMISNDLPPQEFLKEAIFAAGSFWELETAFGRVDGVVRTAVGYYGGNLVKPSYKEVSSEGSTGHTEAVKVIYDTRNTSYKTLCKVFWASHDPTKKEYLKFGVHTHYRSAIFYEDEEEKKQAQQSKVKQQMKLNRRIVTKILPCHSINISGFYLAESHHQKYYLQRSHIRLCECLSLRSAEQLADSHLACKLNGILGGDEKTAVEGLQRFAGRYQLPDETKFVLETIIQELRVKQALEE
ncbi:peptide methionine sulfoxide reductase-like [Phoenix dactylifera]|uniref:peptide-methionine (S)-S-oxide reductase n=1 Tax=Phoenix dactylifera TaxID=42345 RepID=A0A8B7D3G1_PHODC|nr:peptide methionine sulfoxide reductase-like [Phoenix dactylifera]